MSALAGAAALCLYAAAAIAQQTPADDAPADPPRAGIAWQGWSPAVFEQAARDNRLVLVDVGIEGCVACREMHRGTYQDPRVIAWVQRHAVAVHADADMQPDLGERFDPWGWPAIGILAPSGQTLWMIRGHREAPRFVAILEEVLAEYRAGKTPELLEPPASPAAADLQQAAAAVQTWIDERSGAHGFARGLIADAPVELALARRRATGSDATLPAALAQAANTRKILDPEWGGVFYEPTSEDWSTYTPEKRTVTQAAALSTFALIAPLDADGKALAAAREIDRYLQEVMRGSDGLYTSTERDEIPNLPAGMTAIDYYELSGAQRLQYGRPVRDRASYTAENGLVALAYLHLHQASGEPLWLQRGEQVLDTILASRMTERGFLRQAAATAEVHQDQRLYPVASEAEQKLFLRPQVQVGFALVALHEATGEARYLDAARSLEQQLQALATPGGGFQAAEPRGTDALLTPRTPGFDNAWAARFLLALEAATGEAAYGDKAERVLKSIQGVEATTRSEGIAGAALYALALQQRSLGAVDVAVTGDADDRRAKALLDVGYRLADGRVFAHLDRARKYPRADQPTAYVCTRVACSSPIRDTAALKAKIEAELRAPVARR